MKKEKGTEIDYEAFNDILKASGNDFALPTSDEVFDRPERYLTTGSYTLNALSGGSIFSGFPRGQVIGIAGEPATGKTFYALQACEEFLNEYPNGVVCYFESENAKEMIIQQLKKRGIDRNRFILLPVLTVQEFRTQAVKILDHSLSLKENKRIPMFFVLDSLGNLSTTKEVEEIQKGSETKDMTRAQLLRGAFRVLNQKLGRADVDMIVTCHVYDSVGAYIPTKKIGGGDGLVYAASTIIFLSKTKDKSDDDVRGALIKATLKKGRLTVENRQVTTRLLYESGLDKYYGLLDLALKFGIFKKVGNKIDTGTDNTSFEKSIINNPEKYFTQEVLEKIDEKCKAYFRYGSNVDVEVVEYNEEGTE